MYGFIDKSVFEVILNTCRKTEIPPKPRRKAAKIILIESFLHAIEEIILIPFVISNKPVINPLAKVISILKNLKIGLTRFTILFRIPLAFNIDIMLEKITIKPPIIRIVEILFVMLSDSISPRLDIFTKVLVDLLSEIWVVFLGLKEAFFQNLKIIPTVIQAKICVINNNSPITELPNIKIPTVPIIKSGPELFVKLSNLSHSSFEQILFFLNDEAIFAPTGYPLIIPIIKAKEPSPLTLNNGFIKGFRKMPNILIILVCINNSVETKKGNNEGTTDVAQSESPDLTAGKFDFEKIKIHIAKNINIKPKIFLFIFKT